MRDIRRDLRDRIAAKRRDKAKALAAAEAAEADVKVLERLLADEETRIATDDVHTLIGAGAYSLVPCAPKVPLDDFIIKSVAYEGKTLAELTESAIAAGYFVDTASSPGRVMHAKVLHLVKAERLQKEGGRIILGIIKRENALTISNA